MKRKKKMHQHKTALQALLCSMKAGLSPSKQHRTDLKQDINLLDKGDCVCMSR